MPSRPIHFAENMGTIVKIHLIFEATEDGDAAWLVDAWDEYSIDGNPEGFDEAVKRAQQQSTAGRIRVITTLLNYEKVLAAFEPTEIEATDV